MEKKKVYSTTKFPSQIIKSASELFENLSNSEDEWLITLTISFFDEEWEFDDEEEFFAEYRKPFNYAHYKKFNRDCGLFLSVYDTDTHVSVQSSNRSLIHEVFDVFETNLEASKIEITTEMKCDNLKIFIGHGQSPLWRDLKDHLQDKHGYHIEAYEIGARAGHAIRDILEQMLEESSFAFLVLTGEDETVKGDIRARQNVVHEVGLFQGRLGFSRAIVLLEEGAEEFSNISGIQQIRFSKGNIKETFGDVLATLRREFSKD
jgi:predicted nucleotide-binding protein